MAVIERVATSLGLVTRSAPAPQAPEGFAAQVTPPPRSTVSGLDELVGIDAVYRAFSVIETGVLQLSVDVWRTLSGVTEQLPEAPPLVARPNVDEDGASFYASSCVALAARGNAYWFKTRGSDGSVINLDQLDPLTVHVEVDRKRRLRLFHTDLRRDPYTQADVEHLRLLTLPGKAEGLGPIQAARGMLDGQLALRAYADGWFTDPSHTDAVLRTDQHLTPEQAASYKAQWRATQGMGNGPAVLGAGLDYRTLMLTPAEAQWLESQQFGTTAVARLFGMPAKYMLAKVEGGADTYSNQQQEDQAFLKFTLMRYLREVELALTRLLPRTQRARFNVDALLRTDTKTRYEAHKIGIEAGFLSVPEVRRIENLDPRVTPPPAAAPAAVPAQEGSTNA